MTALEFESTDERRAIVTPGFRLEFRWVGDRWAHALEAPAGSADWVELARTVEGSPEAERDTPARVVSPAYQQFHWRPTDDGAEAMLVGQSGPHHFSAVFSVRAEEGRAVVAVDLADRCRAGVEALASTYLVGAPSGELRDAGTDRVVWDRAIAPGDAPSPRVEGRLTFASTGPTTVALAEAGRRAARVQAVAAIEPGRQTHRCVYTWTWTPYTQI